jgi:hypothetical protein
MKRIYHPYHIWECYNSGFFNQSPHDGITPDEAKEMYKLFLGDLNKFESALKIVITEWRYSCEHFLTNPSINKIAWLGQASACVSLGLPSKFRSGFNLLSIKDQIKANKLAERYFKIWKREYENILENGKDRDIQMEFQM